MCVFSAGSETHAMAEATAAKNEAFRTAMKIDAPSQLADGDDVDDGNEEPAVEQEAAVKREETDEEKEDVESRKRDRKSSHK